MIKSGYKHLNESAIASRYDEANKTSDKVDKALHRYVLDPMNVFEVEVILDDALSKYPNKSSITIYRGLNFDTKEQYDKFMSTIKSGKLKTNRVTSWSPDKNVAKQFSVTKPTYMEFMDSKKMDSINKMYKSKERITGYRGIILKTKIAKGKAIDLTKFSGHAESEILLPKGTYSVSVEDILSFKDQIDNEGLDSIISKMTKSNYKETLDYIITNHSPSELSDESKHRIFTLSTTIRPKYSVSIRKSLNSKKRTFVVNMNVPNTSLLSYFNEEDTAKFKRGLASQYKKMIKELFNNYTSSDAIEWGFDHIKYADYCGVRDNLIKVERETIGKEYNKQDEIVKDINKLSGEDKSKAISNEIERMKRLIASI